MWGIWLKDLRIYSNYQRILQISAMDSTDHRHHARILEGRLRELKFLDLINYVFYLQHPSQKSMITSLLPSVCVFAEGRARKGGEGVCVIAEGKMSRSWCICM
ncbi:hypothetical protein L6452_26990 [Arctium lappa]|uniref:Uncharacterized protein n=1 Tax=Arctium lappa TaxID=4217 RepID=A0ACB8ZWG4_ARCLA|nr:hypothetical protein L6452_26990 [Arctium lappa]